MVGTEPKITCLMCNFAFCQNQMNPSSNIKVARVNCVGEVDPTVIFEIFKKGTDGIILAGCQPQECHFQDGNLQAERAVKTVKKLMNASGFEKERLRLIWDSPIDESFIKAFQDFRDEIAKLGSSPLKNAKSDAELMINMLASQKTAADFRLRVLLGYEEKVTENKNAYGEKLTEPMFDALLDDTVENEFVRNKILLLTKTTPLSVKELAQTVKLTPHAVLKQIVNLRRKNLIALERIEGTTPKYKAMAV